MNWLNIKTSDLSSPEYIGSEPVSRATWLSVMGYCAVQENGGIIRNCKGWGDRQWQQICGITCAEIEASNLLMTWDGSDLVVAFYPIDQQEKYQNKRKAGKSGGLITSEAKAAAARANGAKNKPSETQADSQANTQAEPKHRPNVKERKGKESKGNPNIAPVPAALCVVQDYLLDPPDEEPRRERNLLMDALAGCGGADPLQIVPSAWSGIGKALADIKSVCPDVTPDEIARRAANYRTHMENAPLTPNALAKNWALCDKRNQYTKAGQKPGGTSTYELEARAHGYTL